jgi:hypothetical protein
LSGPCLPSPITPHGASEEGGRRPADAVWPRGGAGAWSAPSCSSRTMSGRRRTTLFVHGCGSVHAVVELRKDATELHHLTGHYRAPMCASIFHRPHHRTKSPEHQPDRVRSSKPTGQNFRMPCQWCETARKKYRAPVWRQRIIAPRSGVFAAGGTHLPAPTSRFV